jgi:tight adherence protein B
MTVPAAALLVAVACWFLFVPEASVLRIRARTSVVLGCGVTLGAVLVALLGRRVGWVLVLICLGVAVALLLEVRHRRRRAVVERRQDAVLVACDGIVADLAAGVSPLAALEAVTADWPEFALVAEAVRLGSDAPTALRRLAERPGAEQLRWVAAAWTVSQHSGAGLAAAVGLAATGVREARSTARVIATELASARATARLLAILPVGVLLIGRGAGGDPFGFLFGTTAGEICLGLGLALSWTGLQWLERIADRVGRS